MNNKSLKIVYIIHNGLFSPGGIERIVTLKANYLADIMGYDVSIVTTEQLGRPVYFPISEKVHLIHLDIGIYVNFDKENYVEKCISRFKKTKEFVRELKNILYQIRPDITVSTLGLDIESIPNFNDGSVKIGELHFPANFRQLKANKYSKHFIPNFVAKIRTENMKKACAKLSKLIVLTQEEKASWKGFDNIEVIPNALSFYPETISTCEVKRAIAVGRLVYEKGFDLLIDAWSDVYEKHPDWELHIFGDGDEKEKLLNLIQEKQLGSVVKIHEPEKDIYKEYVKHSMFIFPSRYLEALPMVLIEAMSCGLPIVAYDSPCGPKDIVADGENGFLIKYGDDKTLINKINTLIESEKLRKSMGEKAHQMSLNYSEEIIMKQWVELFKCLIK